MTKRLNWNQPTLNTGLAIAIGEFRDTTAIDKFGYNSSVGATYETVWDAGDVYAYPGSAVALTATSAGGATDENVEITIIGLDENWAEQTEVVTLNASGVATTNNTFIRVFRAYTSNGQDLTGTCNITNGGVTYAQIGTEFQQTMMAVYTIPAGKTGYLVSGNISSQKDKDVTAKLMMREFGGVIRTKGLVLTPGQPFQRQWVVPLAIPAKTDIEIRAKTGATGPIAAGFEIILVENN
jgi:hypothetical protein